MHWKNKKVLVTGGAGVIGRELINQLNRLEVRIQCIDREPQPEDLVGKCEYHRADISQIDMRVMADFTPEVIFHLAASFERTEETKEFWEINYRDNIVVSHKVIDAAKNIKQLEKFIFASSYLVYSPSLYLFEVPQSSARCLKEDNTLNPRNLTGAAKYYIEKELEFTGVMYFRCPVISARIFRVYGRGSGDVVSRWIRAGINKEETTVYQKENMFDYIFAGEVAEGLIRMAERVNSNEIINLGSGSARTIKEVIQNIQKITPGMRIKESEKTNLFEASSADISKLMRLTSWKPSTTFEQGIEIVYEYEKKSSAERQRCIKAR